MNTSLHSPIAPGRKFSASVCLLAALLLWAPLWATALQANGMTCCDGVMCAAHGSSSSNHDHPQAAAQQTKKPMRCGHSGGNANMSCDLSCCHEQSHSFVASIQFVLPNPTVLLQPQSVIGTSGARVSVQILPSFDPLSPPPRTSSL